MDEELESSSESDNVLLVDKPVSLGALVFDDGFEKLLSDRESE